MNRKTARGVVTSAGLLALIFFASFPAAASGFRSITTVTGDYEFSGSPSSVETDEVFLAQLIPALSLEARVNRNQFFSASGGTQHLFYLGPVVSFTDTIYAVAIYGLGFDTQSKPIHEVDVDFDWETDTAAAFVGFKGDYFTATGSWYVLPSVGGKFHLIPALGLFGEYFMSWNNLGQITGAFWGQADYTLNPVVTILVGFTVSFSTDLGYSLIGGAEVTITPDIVLTDKLSFLSNVVEYETPSPTISYGIQNLLSLDWKF